MSCHTSFLIHLLRGIGALVLVVVTFFVAPIYPIVIVPMLVGAVLLLRGCPICWFMGLIEKWTNKLSLNNERK